MAESTHERIVAALQAWLELAGADEPEGLPPDRVVRAPAFHSGLLAKAGLKTVYALVPNQVIEKPITSAIGIIRDLTVDIGVATKFTPDTEDAFDQSPPIRWTVQTRLERDAKRRLFANYNLLGDGVHQFTSVPITEYAADLTYLKGWAVVYLRAVLRYISRDGLP